VPPAKIKMNARTNNDMKKILATKLRSRLRPLLTVAALFALNTVPLLPKARLSVPPT